MTWTSDRPAEEAPISLLGWLRVAVRGLCLAALVFGGLFVLLALRLAERPLFGLRRPWTPYITQFVCRGAFYILGIKHETEGAQMTTAGAIVANHSSWLDIFALNARKRVYFVSKSEVASWPGIGWLARATGTVFIRRDPRDAKIQQDIFEARLLVGHKLLFFPEGTSTDGLRLLPFKPTLFQAFFADPLRERLAVQPVTVVYEAPKGEEDRFYGWWGDMAFGPHLLKTLSAPRGGEVRIKYHRPLAVADFQDRKALAKAAEAAVRDGLPKEKLIAGKAYDKALGPLS